MHEEDWDSTPQVAPQAAGQYQAPKRAEPREFNNYQRRGPPQQRDQQPRDYQQRDQPREYNNYQARDQPREYNNYQPRDQQRNYNNFQDQPQEFNNFPNREFRNRNNFNDRRRDNQGENNFGRSNQDRGRRENEGEATILKVPTRFVGRIIGRGGSKINELQSESQAKIQVTKDTEGETTIIKMYGSPDEVTKATELINDLTVDRF